jgi:diguanylate cyclase (GGDEF)-like protein
MQKSTIIVVRDRLEPFESVLSELQKVTSRRVFITSRKDLTDGLPEELLREIDSMDRFVLMEEGLYSECGEELGARFSSLFKCEFRNYLLIRDGTPGRPAWSFPREKGSLPFFPVSRNLDPALQARYMEMYLDVLMENATLTDRLTRYIADSFQVVVYSELINRKNREIELLNKELELKNKTDGLTHLYNRNALFDFLEQERKRTMRDLWRLSGSRRGSSANASRSTTRAFPHKPRGSITDHFGIFSVLMIDMDNFKTINDLYGHLAGDEVLRAFGDIFREQHILRENDVAGRFGGEEFVVVLPGTKAANASEPAARLLDSFRKIDFNVGSGEHFKVSFSIGISQFNPRDKGCDEVIERADKALYYAKEHGRDRIVVYEQAFRKKRKKRPPPVEP